jgi:mono/diheme cytochrome c family protein
MRHLSKIRSGALLALFGAASLGLAGTALAATPDTEAASYGRVTYGRYCRNCHGPQARGDGPVAELLTVRTPDLTQISARNNGSFPAERVTETIDGRRNVLAHGTSEMPIWGDALQRPEQGGDQEAAVREKIRQLVEYLRSIQAPPPAP